MAPTKKLPDDDVLLKHVADGLSNREIADKYGTTPEAVRQALVKLGIKRGPERPNHAHYLPWRVRSDHVNDLLARRLRTYSKRMQGKPLTQTESRLLDSWVKFMDGENSLGIPLSVHYDRRDDDGFWLEPRQAGDRDYICPPV